MAREASGIRFAQFLRIAVLAIAAAWTANGVPTRAEPALPKIIAVGDLHGDFGAWQDIERGAGLVDVAGHWIAGKTILVQMGDITDREPDSLKIIRSLQQLQREAPRKGGRVYVILGNHEAMNLLGDNRYTTPGEYAAFVDSQSEARRDRIYEVNRATIEASYKSQTPSVGPSQARSLWLAAHPLGWAEHRLAWGPSGELGQWARSNPAILKLDGTLFVHGGISMEYSKQPLQTVNARVAKAMETADNSNASVLLDPLGPLWYRGLLITDQDAQAQRAAMKPPAAVPSAEQELGTILAAYDAQRLVVAHTPNLKGISILYGGRLVDVDTGNSRFYGGPLSWLEIIGGQMTPHQVVRSR